MNFKSEDILGIFATIADDMLSTMMTIMQSFVRKPLSSFNARDRAHM